MKRSIRFLFSVLITQSSVLLAAAAASACPMCSSGSNDLAARYTSSVTLLSYLPIGIAVVVGTLIYRSIRPR